MGMKHISIIVSGLLFLTPVTKPVFACLDLPYRNDLKTPDYRSTPASSLSCRHSALSSSTTSSSDTYPSITPNRSIRIKAHSSPGLSSEWSADSSYKNSSTRRKNTETPSLISLGQSPSNSFFINPLQEEDSSYWRASDSEWYNPTETEASECVSFSQDEGEFASEYSEYSDINPQFVEEKNENGAKLAFDYTKTFPAPPSMRIPGNNVIANAQMKEVHKVDKTPEKPSVNHNIPKLDMKKLKKRRSSDTGLSARLMDGLKKIVHSVSPKHSPERKDSPKKTIDKTDSNLMNAGKSFQFKRKTSKSKKKKKQISQEKSIPNIEISEMQGGLKEVRSAVDLNKFRVRETLETPQVVESPVLSKSPRKLIPSVEKDAPQSSRKRLERTKSRSMQELNPKQRERLLVKESSTESAADPNLLAILKSAARRAHHETIGDFIDFAAIVNASVPEEIRFFHMGDDKHLTLRLTYSEPAKEKYPRMASLQLDVFNPDKDLMTFIEQNRKLDWSFFMQSIDAKRIDAATGAKAYSGGKKKLFINDDIIVYGSHKDVFISLIPIVMNHVVHCDRYDFVVSGSERVSPRKLSVEKRIDNVIDAYRQKKNLNKRV